MLGALQRYTERSNYVHKLLCSLFNMTQYLEKPRPDIVKVSTLRSQVKEMGNIKMVLISQVVNFLISYISPYQDWNALPVNI